VASGGSLRLFATPSVRYSLCSLLPLFATPSVRYSLCSLLPLFATSLLAAARQGSGTPTDALSHDAVPAGTAAHFAKRARLSAFHRGSFVRRRNAPVQLIGERSDAVLRAAMARLPGNAAATITLLGGRLPTPAYPSPVEAPHGPVIVPVSMMPRAARERIVTPPAGTALAPSSGVPSRRRPLVERDSEENVTDIVTNVVTCMETI